MFNSIKQKIQNTVEKAKDMFYSAGAYMNRGQLAMAGVKENMTAKRKGAFSFEYIIVLAVMVVIIFAAWQLLNDAVMDKVAEIKDHISNTNVGDGDGSFGN